MKYIDSPLFVFECNNFIIIGPTQGIFGSFIYNLKTITNYYNAALKLVK